MTEEQQMLQQLQQENASLKTTLANEVMHRQQLGAQLTNVSNNAQSMQISFGESLQAIRAMNKAGDKGAISAKIDSLIGPEPKEPAPAPEAEPAKAANKK